MPMLPFLPRRRFLHMLGAGAVSLHSSAATAKPLRGIFPIAQTPFTDSNQLDLGVLADHVRFLDRMRVHGVVWPQNASEWSTLTVAERFAGAEVVLSVGTKLRPAVVIGVQSPDL